LISIDARIDALRGFGVDIEAGASVMGPREIERRLGRWRDVGREQGGSERERPDQEHAVTRT
jgi:hypothetical protein